MFIERFMDNIIINILDTLFKSGVFAVAVGFLLGLIPDILRARAKKKKAIAALKCEIEYCAYLSGQYLEKTSSVGGGPSKFASFLRYPVIAFQNSFPSILAATGVKADIVYRITDYYCQISALNNILNHLESKNFDKNESKLLNDIAKNIAFECSMQNKSTQSLIVSLDDL
jgi:hypothetical protein